MSDENIIKTIIEMILKDDQFQAAIGNFKEKIDTVDKQHKTFIDNMKFGWVELKAKIDLFVQGFQIVFNAIKKGFDFGKEYIEFQKSSNEMQSQFGVNADKVIAKLKEMSLGTVSNKDIVVAANRAMAMNVTKDINQLGLIFEYAKSRGEVLGISTVQAFDQIMSGIARATPKILTGMGIVSKGLMEEGVETGKLLTSHQMLNIVLEKAGESHEKLGSGVMSADDKLEKFNATIQNAKLWIGENLLPAMELLLNISNKISDAFTNGNVQLRGYNTMIENLSNSHVTLAANQKGTTTGLNEHFASTGQAKVKVDELNQQLKKQSSLMADLKMDYIAAGEQEKIMLFQKISNAVAKQALLQGELEQVLTTYNLMNEADKKKDDEKKVRMDKEKKFIEQQQKDITDITKNEDDNKLKIQISNLEKLKDNIIEFGKKIINDETERAETIATIDNKLVALRKQNEQEVEKSRQDIAIKRQESIEKERIKNIETYNKLASETEQVMTSIGHMIGGESEKAISTIAHTMTSAVSDIGRLIASSGTDIFAWVDLIMKGVTAVWDIITNDNKKNLEQQQRDRQSALDAADRQQAEFYRKIYEKDQKYLQDKKALEDAQLKAKLDAFDKSYYGQLKKQEDLKAEIDRRSKLTPEQLRAENIGIIYANERALIAAQQGNMSQEAIRQLMESQAQQYRDLNIPMAGGGGGYATGSSYLASDQFAQVHMGERIIPASMNPGMMSNTELMANAWRGMSTPTYYTSTTNTGGNKYYNLSGININNVKNATDLLAQLEQLAENTGSRILSR